MTHEELAYLPATELAHAIRTRTISPVEATEAVLARIEALNPTLNAYCLVLGEEARAAARAAEDAVIRSEPLGPLHGVPVSIKDMVLTKGIRTMQGSAVYAERVPDEDPPMVERLKAAGAILLGKTTTPEFGWKAVTDSPVSGITRNPWDPAMTPGGSSGGAAAQVAAGMGHLASGGDGAGSIRVPCSFSGVFGIKPHYGRVPFYPQGGLDQMAHLGPITRSVADAALMLSVMAGPDSRDRTSLNAPHDDYVGRLHEGVRGLRVAWSPTLGYVDNLDPQVRALNEQAAHAFEALGCRVELVENPGFGDPKALVDFYWRASFAQAVAPYLEQWADRMDPALVACAREGMDLRARDLVDVMAERHQYWYRVRPLFETYDLLLTPAVAVLPFEAGRLYPADYPEHPWDWIRWAPYSYPFNLTHQPAASVPCGFSREGLPVGLQIVGRRFAELTVLQAAAAYEAAHPWAGHRPPL